MNLKKITAAIQLFLDRNKKSESVKIYACVRSNVGRQRIDNEDNYILHNTINVGLEKDAAVDYEHNLKDNKWFCAGVFDGMGGGSKGELAALWAAQSFYHKFEDVLPDGYESIDYIARRCFLDANRKIVQEKPDDTMYGTTGTVFLTNGSKFSIYHIGDSRCYLLRDMELKQLTQDQTVAAMKERLGIYETDVDEIRKNRSELTTYIGCDTSLENLVPRESGWISVSPGDKILICSDGLYDAMNDSEIKQCISKEPDIKKSVEMLLKSTLNKDAADNVTVLQIVFEKKGGGKHDAD